MDQAAYTLDDFRREIVLDAIQEVCASRTWYLVAAQVRSTHVHVVVEAGAEAERVMNDFKTYASRALNKSGLDAPDRKRWTRHGSTKYLWEPEDVAAAVRYVIDAQGEPMAVFEATAP